MTKKVSIVLCTYNGARYLNKQLDSIISQTYPIYELIIQDDGSTDDTMNIAESYASRFSFIKCMRNTSEHGYNPNFFSAMQKATGEFIAISDQDDIWEKDKIEKQIKVIGDNLMCTHRTLPFSEDGSSVRYDKRTPNVGLLRLMYASIPGHTTLFKRDLLSMIPDISNNFYGTAYDVILSVTAAAYERLVLIDEPLVHQRRYSSAVSYTEVDKRRTPGCFNGLYILVWSLVHYPKVKPLMVTHFSKRVEMLMQIKSTTAIYREAVKMLDLQTSHNLFSIIRLQSFFIRHRFEIFYTKGKDPQNFIRAMLHPIMQIYNYKYLLNTK